MNQEIQKQHLIPNWHSRGANDSSLTVLFAAYGLISKAKNNIWICLAWKNSKLKKLSRADNATHFTLFPNWYSCEY